MNIGSICTRDVVTVDQDMSLQEVAQSMRDKHVGSVVVIGNSLQGTSVMGVVTDRDLALQVLTRAPNGASVTVGSLCSGRLVAIPLDASISDAVLAMESEGVRRLLVTGDQKELVGLVSLDDLLEAWATDMSRLAQSLKKARAREIRASLSPLTYAGVPLTLPNEALLPSWQASLQAA
jgi:CBS domain-containing protein